MFMIDFLDQSDDRYYVDGNENIKNGLLAMPPRRDNLTFHAVVLNGGDEVI
jgi:hypothetical protein